MLDYPSARLFVDRITARGSRFSLSDDEAPSVAEICRKLDGIPLAIELAAGRAAVFGVKDTAARLGSRLDLLKFGRRTANARHQTLRATLDWSYDHLSEIERVVFRRVSIFTGNFTLEAAIAVAEEEGIGQADVTDAMGRLVNKSLIGSRIESGGNSYRLLDTTRTYAFERLAPVGSMMRSRRGMRISLLRCWKLTAVISLTWEHRKVSQAQFGSILERIDFDTRLPTVVTTGSSNVPAASTVGLRENLKRRPAS